LLNPPGLVRIKPEIVSGYRTALYQRTQHRPQKLRERTVTKSLQSAVSVAD
jgi:hypothetical protein